MAFDSVPWFVGGGAQHSPEVARLLAYAATSGAEGIVTPGDMKVVPLDVPGGAARVVPGAALISNRSAGGGQQTYVARLPVADQVEIAATGSSGGRSDLIIAQIEDPFLPGEPWQEPADPTVGPYVFTRVISNVPAGTTRLQDVAGYEGRSAITLARVDLPSSTGTVTAAIITDLRKVALPRTENILRTYALVTGDEETLTSTNTSSGEVWPNGTTTAWAGVDIPEWATRVRIVAQWFGVLAPPGNAWGRVWVDIGADASSQSVGFDTPDSSGNTRMTFACSDDRAIPAAYRGTRRNIWPKAYVAAGAPSAARPKMDAGSSMVLQLEFYETPA